MRWNLTSKQFPTETESPFYSVQPRGRGEIFFGVDSVQKNFRAREEKFYKSPTFPLKMDQFFGFLDS